MTRSRRQLAICRPLDERSVARTLRTLLPRRNDYRETDYGELLGELNAFDIRNRRQLRRLILRNLRDTIQIDREPFDEFNARIVRAEIGDTEFLRLERRRIFFNLAGLVRVALELEFGGRYRAFAARRAAAIPIGILR